jgi:hypothetical protein
MAKKTKSQNKATQQFLLEQLVNIKYPNTFVRRLDAEADFKSYKISVSFFQLNHNGGHVATIYHTSAGCRHK